MKHVCSFLLNLAELFVLSFEILSEQIRNILFYNLVVLFLIFFRQQSANAFFT